MMKPPRSALPLPRYTLRKALKGGTWGFFFNVPMWARKTGCGQERASRHRLRSRCRPCRNHSVARV
jgi:hypothetical protein